MNHIVINWLLYGQWHVGDRVYGEIITILRKKIQYLTNILYVCVVKKNNNSLSKWLTWLWLFENKGGNLKKKTKKNTNPTKKAIKKKRKKQRKHAFDQEKSEILLSVFYKFPPLKQKRTDYQSKSKSSFLEMCYLFLI